MKKTIIKISIFIGTLIFSSQAFAATDASLSPKEASIAPGSAFTLTISLDPHGSANYAEKLELDYPADLLEVRSFTLNSSWTALTQAGYDSIDNAKGMMIKSAGYSGGFSKDTVFGTVTFVGKKSGTASVSFGTGSKAYDASGEASLSGGSAAVTIASKAIAPSSSPKASPSVSPKGTPKAVAVSSSVPLVSSALAATPAETPSQAGAAAAAGGNLKYILIGGALLVVAGLLYAATASQRPGKVRRKR